MLQENLSPLLFLPDLLPRFTFLFLYCLEANTHIRVSHLRLNIRVVFPRPLLYPLVLLEESSHLHLECRILRCHLGCHIHRFRLHRTHFRTFLLPDFHPITCHLHRPGSSQKEISPLLQCRTPSLLFHTKPFKLTGNKLPPRHTPHFCQFL